MCDPCIELLDVSTGFKERCLEIFYKSFPEESLQEDELVLYETEEYVDEPSEDLEIPEHAENTLDPFQESVLDEDTVSFVQDVIPETSSRGIVPVIRASTKPTTSLKKHSSPRLKGEPKKSTNPVGIQITPNGVRLKVGKSRMSYTSSKKLEVS